MCNAIRRVNHAISISHEAWERIASVFGLARREAEVLKCIVSDQHENDIAVSLGLSRHTVRTYLKRLRLKLGVHSRVAMVKRVLVEHSTLGGESNPP